MSAERPALDVATPPSPDRVARQRYAARMRPRRIAYTGVLVALAVAIAGLVKIAYFRGEISHTTLRTVPTAPRSVALQTPSTALTEVWANSDHTAIGQPYWGGTVVSYDRHSVRGRDARTGRTTWTYTRTDRTVCSAIQDQGVTIAVYELNGNCDQLTAVNTDTGNRKWNRTLDKDGAELNGHPTYTVLASTVMFTTPGAVYALDPIGGGDRWVFKQRGCSVRGAALGSSGALISQTCRGRDCAGLKFCGNGVQLLLRAAMTGEDDNTSTNKGNRDQIQWNLVGNDLLPATADQIVSALSPDGAQLSVLGVDKGTTITRLPVAAHSTVVTSVPAADGQLVRIGTTTYAVRDSDDSIAWRAVTRGPVTVTDRSGTGVPNLADAILAVPTARGVGVVDPDTGALRTGYPVGAPPAGSQAYPYGTGFVVAGTRTAYYR